MPRKKSIKGAAQNFRDSITQITTYLATCCVGQTDEHQSWMHNYAIIRLYRSFESFILECIIGAMNNDTATLTATAGITFPRHLTDEVCEYIVTKNGYFDFKGRDGLIKTLNKYIPDTHYLSITIREARYRVPIERLCALRNFAAHESYTAKRSVREATGAERIASSGSWLKASGRFNVITASLDQMAQEIYDAAPY